jgi:hypothetical protein
MNKLLIPVLFFGFIQIAGAQVKNELIEKIVELKARKLIDKFQLTGDTAEEFKNMLKNHTYTTSRLSRKRRQTMKQINDNYQSGEGLDSLLEKLIETEDSLYTERKNFLNNLRSILDPVQIARMIIDERKFNNELRDTIRELRKKRKEKRFKEE